MYALIRDQVQAWEGLHTIPAGFSTPGPYLFLGSGTSHYLAKVASAKATSIGLLAQAAPTSELLMDPEVWTRHFKTFVFISRSGATSEAVAAAKLLRDRGRSVVAISSHRDSPLPQIANEVFIAEGSEDDTVVMIRSFTTMLLLLQNLVSVTGGLKPHPVQALTKAFADVFQQSKGMTETLAQHPVRRAYVLGGGVRQGIADEGVLKMQEMAGAMALAFNPLEFRHGPWGSITEDDVVFLLGQRRRATYEHALLNDLRQRGSRVIPIAPNTWLDPQLGHHGAAVALPDAVADSDCGPLAVVPLQVWAWRWALVNGENPDAPRNLTRVVVLKNE